MEQNEKSNELQKIRELRRHIPIGITHARIVLLQSDGDIEQAIAIWKKEQQKQLARILGVEPGEATRFLELAKYDQKAAREIHYEERYSYLERLIHIAEGGDPKRAVNLFLRLVRDCMPQLYRDKAWLFHHSEYAHLPFPIDVIEQVNTWFEYLDAESELTVREQQRDEIIIEILEMPELLPIIEKEELIASLYVDAQSDRRPLDEILQLQNDLQAVHNQFFAEELKVKTKLVDLIRSNLEMLEAWVAERKGED